MPRARRGVVCLETGDEYSSLSAAAASFERGHVTAGSIHRAIERGYAVGGLHFAALGEPFPAGRPIEGGDDGRLTIDQVSELLGLGAAAVSAMADAGEVGFERISGRWVIGREALLRGLGLLPPGMEDDGSPVLDLARAMALMRVSRPTAVGLARAGDIAPFSFFRGRWFVMEGPLLRGLGLDGTEDALLSLEDVAGRCSVSMGTVRRAVKGGGIPSVALGKRRFVPRAAFEAAFGLEGHDDVLVPIGAVLAATGRKDVRSCERLLRRRDVPIRRLCGVRLVAESSLAAAGVPLPGAARDGEGPAPVSETARPAARRETDPRIRGLMAAASRSVGGINARTFAARRSGRLYCPAWIGRLARLSTTSRRALALVLTYQGDIDGALNARGGFSNSMREGSEMVGCRPTQFEAAVRTLVSRGYLERKSCGVGRRPATYQVNFARCLEDALLGAASEPSGISAEIDLGAWKKALQEKEG
jgi:hypothetical protein